MTRIGGSAFYGARFLTSVQITSGVEEIGDLAYANAELLTQAFIPDSVTTIGNRAFARNSGSSDGNDLLTIYGSAGSEAERYGYQRYTGKLLC